jgi:hypothetical protein
MMYLMPEIFSNSELSLPERTMTEEDYRSIVAEIFDFYPKLVRTKVSSVKAWPNLSQQDKQGACTIKIFTAVIVAVS